MALQAGNPQPSPRVAPALEKPGLATFSRESDLALTAGLWGQTGLSVNWIQCTCDLGKNSLASLSPGACIEKEELPPAGTVVMLARGQMADLQTEPQGPASAPGGRR